MSHDFPLMVLPDMSALNAAVCDPDGWTCDAAHPTTFFHTTYPHRVAFAFSNIHTVVLKAYVVCPIPQIQSRRIVWGSKVVSMELGQVVNCSYALHPQGIPIQMFRQLLANSFRADRCTAFTQLRRTAAETLLGLDPDACGRFWLLPKGQLIPLDRHPTSQVKGVFYSPLSGVAAAIQNLGPVLVSVPEDCPGGAIPVPDTHTGLNFSMSDASSNGPLV